MSTFQFIDAVLRPPTYRCIETHGKCDARLGHPPIPFHILAACFVCADGRMARSTEVVLRERRTGVAVEGFTGERPAVLFVSPIRVFRVPFMLAEIKYDL